MVRTRRQRETTKETKIEDSDDYKENEPKTSITKYLQVPVKKEIGEMPLQDNDDGNNLASSFMFQGQKFDSYEDMVKAKRKRNADFLKSTGLLETSAKMKYEMNGPDLNQKRAQASQRGLRSGLKRKDHTQVTTTRRKSSRLAGVQADGIFVEEERGGGRIVVGGVTDDMKFSIGGNHIEVIQEEDRFYNRRINDGSSLSVEEAVGLSGSKWVKENSTSLAQGFTSELQNYLLKEKDSRQQSPRSTTATGSDENLNSLKPQADGLSLDAEDCVAKVVPDRIYSLAFHPSPHKLIVAAGDKKGHVGLWDIDASSNNSDRNGVHLFKPYNTVASNLEWNRNGSKLFTSSYDGSMRIFDVQRETFTEVFATYDSSPEYKGKLGFGLDDGWMQYSCIDHRNDDCIFYSNSVGDVVHIDLRQKSKITFNSNLSEKKINSISLHPTGNALATCGLDCTVNIWDIRKINSSKTVQPIASQHNTRSINSAFFSPSGKHLLTTTMSDTLDIITDAHLVKGTIKQPTHRIRHNNKTGRWLSTFMAQWHPSKSLKEDLFVVGSMQQPRTLQIFDGDRGELVRDINGDALTAVVSRCCFHPSGDKLIVAGGNSSGRVTVARS